MSVTYYYDTAAGVTSSGTSTTSGNVLVTDNFLVVTSGSTVTSPTLLVSAVDLSTSGSAAANPADATLVYSGGNTVVTIGGTTQTLNGGGAIVYSGGTIITATVEAGGALYVEGGTTSSTIVSGGLEFVFSGGLSSGATVSAGTQAVYSGGTVSTATIDATGYLEVYAGGTAVSAGIGAGAQEDILSGGNAVANNVFAGANQTVHAGGTVSFDQITGGNAYIYGTATSATVTTSGTEDVMSGGHAISTTLTSGGVQIISAGGEGIGINVSGLGVQDIASGGVANASFVSGGIVNVMSGGTEINLHMGTAGEMVVSGGGLSTGAIASGGQIEVLAGGDTSGTLLVGGQELIMSGGVVNGTTVSETQATSTTAALYGSEIVLAGGVANGTVVETGGSVIVYQGGQVTNLQVVGAGVVSLYSGAIVSGDIVLSGTGAEVQFLGITLASAKIDGLAVGDKIDLANLSVAQVAYANGEILLENSSGTTIGSITLGTTPDGLLSVASDGQGGSLITVEANVLTAAAAAASFEAGSLYTQINVTDSAADISANLSTLESIFQAGKLSGVTLTDSGVAAISVTATQLAADSNVLNGINGTLVVTVDASATSNATITGLSNHATVVSFAGDASQYTVTAVGDGASVHVSGTSIGTDTISDAAMLKFADFTEVLASTTPVSGATLSSANVAELYAATLDREPDAAGLVFYENLIKSAPTTSFVTVASYFLSSPEYTASHSYAQTTTGDASFVGDLYTNLLHRTGSSTEITYYQNVINQFTSGLTVGTAAYDAAELTGRATVLSYFSASPEFLTNIEITAQNPASAQHWLVLL